MGKNPIGKCPNVQIFKRTNGEMSYEHLNMDMKAIELWMSLISVYGQGQLSDWTNVLKLFKIQRLRSSKCTNFRRSNTSEPLILALSLESLTKPEYENLQKLKVLHEIA